MIFLPHFHFSFRIMDLGSRFMVFLLLKKEIRQGPVSAMEQGRESKKTAAR